MALASLDYENSDFVAICYIIYGMLENNSTLMPSYYNILHQVCQAEQIDLRFFATNWVKQLSKGNKIHYIIGYKFDLNPAAASAVADDKAATSEILRTTKIPVIEHSLLYNFANQADYTLGRNSLNYARKYFDTHDQHVVVKPNCGTGGRAVYQVTDFAQVPAILAEIFAEQPTASLCPFYQIRHEYRVILLDDTERLAYMKTASADNWKFNLQQGATAGEIADDKHDEILALAKHSARAIGLRFCSVDIIETFAGELLVLEVNSGVMIQKYLEQHPEDLEVIKAIYRDAVRKMFE